MSPILLLISIVIDLMRLIIADAGLERGRFTGSLELQAMKCGRRHYADDRKLLFSLKLVNTPNR